MEITIQLLILLTVIAMMYVGIQNDKEKKQIAKNKRDIYLKATQAKRQMK